MNAQTLSQAIRWDSWELSAEADRRFRRIVLTVGLPILAASILVPFWEFAVDTHEAPKFDTTQYVQLLPEKKVETPKAEEPKPAVKKGELPPQDTKPVKPEIKAVKPEIKPEETAREKAQKVMANSGFDQLADLRDKNLNAITTQQPLNSVITSKGGIGSISPDAIAASAASGSGGIAGGNGVTTSQNGGGLGARSTGSVKSPLGYGTDKHAGGTGDRLSAGRSLNEIKLTFDKNAGPFYAIFNRAGRENANIGRGTIRVNLVIAPNGTVTSCTLVSSTFNDPDFERKVVQRVLLINFGAKAVPVFTTDYPIYFIPQ